ncbi:MAG: geranylgeranyl reductase family protein [bacterium]
MRVVVVGGGPGGSTTAHECVLRGLSVTLLERNLTNDKSCAGGMPSKLLHDFDVPLHVVESVSQHIVMISPTKRETHVMLPPDEALATVKRKVFDKWLRDRAASAGVDMVEAEFIEYEDRGETLSPRYRVHFKTRDGEHHWQEADFVIGADGAISRVAKQLLGYNLKQVIARQKFITPQPGVMESHYRELMEVYYSSEISPDYYGWMFSRKNDISLGMGTGYHNGRLVRPCLENLERFNAPWLEGGTVTDINAAPIPAEQNYRDSARDGIILVGDSAGFVLPALGEGIYYAMLAGRIAAEQIRAYAFEGGPAPATIYPQAVEETLEPLFQIFRTVENWAYSSDFRRELLCSLLAERYYQGKIFATFAMKRAKPNRNVVHKIQQAFFVANTVLRLKARGYNANTGYLMDQGIDVQGEFQAALAGQ